MGKSNNKGKAIAAGVVVVLGVIFMVVMALQPYTKSTAVPSPDPASFPAANATAYSTNRVVEVEAALVNNATRTPDDQFTDFLDPSNTTRIVLPASMGYATSFKIASSNATLAAVLGQPLTCANGSNVVFKLLHAPQNIDTGKNPHGIGFVFHANATWWATQCSYLPSDIAETNWPDMLATLLALSN
nr:hypothetical protein [Candidatus Sigynarchaeota archaeon]